MSGRPPPTRRMRDIGIDPSDSDDEDDADSDDGDDGTTDKTATKGDGTVGSVGEDDTTATKGDDGTEDEVAGGGDTTGPTGGGGGGVDTDPTGGGGAGGTGGTDTDPTPPDDGGGGGGQTTEPDTPTGTAGPEDTPDAPETPPEPPTTTVEETVDVQETTEQDLAEGQGVEFLGSEEGDFIVDGEVVSEQGAQQRLTEQFAGQSDLVDAEDVETEINQRGEVTFVATQTGAAGLTASPGEEIGTGEVAKVTTQAQSIEQQALDQLGGDATPEDVAVQVQDGEFQVTPTEGFAAEQLAGQLEQEGMDATVQDGQVTVEREVEVDTGGIEEQLEAEVGEQKAISQGVTSRTVGQGMQETTDLERGEDFTVTTTETDSGVTVGAELTEGFQKELSKELAENRKETRTQTEQFGDVAVRVPEQIRIGQQDTSKQQIRGPGAGDLEAGDPVTMVDVPDTVELGQETDSKRTGPPGAPLETGGEPAAEVDTRTGERVEDILGDLSQGVQQTGEDVGEALFAEDTGFASESGVAAVLRASGRPQLAESVESDIRSFGKATVGGATALADVPGLLAGVKEGAELASFSAGEVGAGRGDELGEDLVAEGQESVTKAVDFAQENPAQFGGLAVGSLAGSVGAFTAARNIGPRTSLATRAAIQPGEEALGIGGFRATRAVAGKAPAQKLFPNQEPLIFSEEAALRKASQTVDVLEPRARSVGAAAKAKGAELDLKATEGSKQLVSDIRQVGRELTTPAQGAEFETEPFISEGELEQQDVGVIERVEDTGTEATGVKGATEESDVDTGPTGFEVEGETEDTGPTRSRAAGRFAQAQAAETRQGVSDFFNDLRQVGREIRFPPQEIEQASISEAELREQGVTVIEQEGPILMEGRFEGETEGETEDTDDGEDLLAGGTGDVEVDIQSGGTFKTMKLEQEFEQETAGKAVEQTRAETLSETDLETEATETELERRVQPTLFEEGETTAGEVSSFFSETETETVGASELTSELESELGFEAETETDAELEQEFEQEFEQELELEQELEQETEVEQELEQELEGELEQELELESDRQIEDNPLFEDEDTTDTETIQQSFGTGIASAEDLLGGD